MGIDRLVKKLARLESKRAKIEYNLAAVGGHILEVQEKINKKRGILQSKLDVIEKNVPKPKSLKEDMEEIAAKQEAEETEVVE